MLCSRCLYALQVSWAVWGINIVCITLSGICLFYNSGYYCVTKDEKWFRYKIIYTLKLLIISELCYWLLNTLIEWLQGISPLEYLNSVLNGVLFVEFIISGGLFCGPLWYLYALVWTWLILLVFKKTIDDFRKVLWLIPVLLIIAIIGRNYCSRFTDPDETIWLFRNAFLYGLPFMLLGMWIRWYGNSLHTREAIIAICIGLVLIVVEYVIYPVIHDFQLSTVFTAIGVFILAVRNQTVGSYLKPFVFIGEKLSLYVYLSHVAWRTIVDTSASLLNLSDNTVFCWVRPLLILVLTLAFSYALSYIHLKRMNAKNS